MAGHNNWPYIVNLGNSIIGVATLAMPFCFKQCGILLGMIVLLFCTWLTLTSCQLLMRAGIHSRRRSYEFLAYYTHGATGKLLSEVGMIGMQVGTLIAQIVVIGDLGPAILSKFLGLENTFGLRTFLILTLCLCVGLPLGLLKDLRAVSRASTVCISFYCIFILYVICLALPNIQSGEWYQKVSFWRTEGFFQCLPILSFSFGCQTQLFLLYDALPDPSLKAINGVISSAVNLCAVAYLLVGFFGYVAFHNIDIPGDVISAFPNTFFADVMKICFVFSIVITFPVIIFPCRSSIYTLLFAKKSKPHDDVLDSDGYLPEKLFKGITVFIVLTCMILGILIPNVEFILGLSGAIMGTLICYVFPALFFLKVMGNKHESRGMAQLVLVLGLAMLLLSTYTTLSSHDKGSHLPEPIPPEDIAQAPLLPRDVVGNPVVGQANVAEQLVKPLVTVPSVLKQGNGKDDVIVKDDRRQEPPNPDPPDVKPADVAPEKVKDVVKDSEGMKKEAPDKDQHVVLGDKHEKKDEEKVIKDTKDAEENAKAADANKAKELELQQKEKKQDELLQQLEKHREEQEKLLEEQRQLLKEFKDHHEKDLKNDLDQEKEKLKEQVKKEVQSEVLQEDIKKHGQQNGLGLNPAQPVNNHQEPDRQQLQQQQLQQNQFAAEPLHQQQQQQQHLPQNAEQPKVPDAGLHRQAAPVKTGDNTGLGAGENLPLRNKEHYVHNEQREPLAGPGGVDPAHQPQQVPQQYNSSTKSTKLMMENAIISTRTPKKFNL
ncbi:hypothetical protein EGW08_021149 [Elysia chlorotica]|uniref:Amino acid transporter transmembrane domain-containing protein n=1 Tax=Elysia chlorotica TaxID=188477 RepID=A0A433SPA7_ELYCH|nr:hypothetical protein EGW08_021149 [Elysia chlorotica]